jgi:hypothetical protein
MIYNNYHYLESQKNRKIFIGKRLKLSFNFTFKRFNFTTCNHPRVVTFGRSIFLRECIWSLKKTYSYIYIYIYIIHAGQIISSVVFQQHIYIHIVFLLRPFFKPTCSKIETFESQQTISGYFF